MQNLDIKWALDLMRARAADYTLYSDYYAGRHRLAFATDKFRVAFGSLLKAFADNVCKTVVNTVADRLQVTGFSSETADTSSTNKDPKSTEPPVDEIGKAAWDIWQVNRMDRQSGTVHTEALRAGDSYVIVWPDESGTPTIYPQEASQVVVYYDTERPGTIMRAAKAWIDNEYRWRMNLYYPDRIEKYATAKPPTTDSLTQPPMPGTARSFVPFDVLGEPWPVPNPYGKVPVFHFANDAAIGKLGMSELADVVPLQDALNKAVCDMLVAMEFVSLPQRWATGLEVDVDQTTGKPKAPFVSGVDRVWSVGAPDAKFGQFEAANLTQFLGVQDSFRMEIARVSRTPLHHLMPTGTYPSGEAMKTAEEPLIAKVKDRGVSWGNVWEDILSFALLIQGRRDVKLSCLWKDPTPRNNKDSMDVLVLKDQIGVSQRQLLREAGYSDEEIDKMQQEKEEEQASLGENLLNAFDRGGTTDGGTFGQQGTSAKQTSTSKATSTK